MIALVIRRRDFLLGTLARPLGSKDMPAAAGSGVRKASRRARRIGEGLKGREMRWGWVGRSSSSDLAVRPSAVAVVEWVLSYCGIVDMVENEQDEGYTARRSSTWL